ncbi:hypothetical protein [Natronohydrobacter thiooxidans]|uniref:hypothetical protein n=1 Tax=Natronohydrobacter thiooxidans TaxID=87172 RepID=UPI0008FF3ED6|nr:hypothetical protein [Natronohydrobacter thiooxidans]
MSYAAAIRNTARAALIFAVIFFAFMVGVALISGETINWLEAGMMTVIATGVYWALMAALKTRRTGK